MIDSEHSKRNFYTQYHSRLLRKIAAICAERISRYQAEEKLRSKIARDLHNEMGSTLTSINIMSKVGMERKMDDSEVTAESNNYRVTAREKEILQWLSKRNSFKLIAAELNIKHETVRTHIKHIYDKLHVQSQTEAVSRAITERLI